MSNVLQHQHKNIPMAYDIMLSLREMFAEQNRSARQVAMKNLYNTKMAEGTPVRDHVLKMMSYLNELEVLGGEIDTESQVDIVLLSLPPSFNQFKLNYNMNKLDFTLAALLNELQAAEGTIKNKPSVFLGEASSTKPKGRFGKKKKKAGKKKGSATGGVKKTDKSKGKCFHCNQKGHWKNDCPKFLAKQQKQGMSQLFVIETCFVARDTTNWCIDSGATDHVCNTLQGFKQTRLLSEGEVYLHLGSDAKVAAEAVGDFHLSFRNGRTLILKDCLYAPFIRRNLISVSSLVSSGYSVNFNKSVIIRMNGDYIY